MDFDDLIEGFDEGVFSLLIPLGVLCGAAVVQWATKRFQRVSQQHGFGVSACGLTGQDVADLRGTQLRTHGVVRSQNAGPTGSMKSPLATRYPSASMVRGSCANARAAGPKIGVA